MDKRIMTRISDYFTCWKLKVLLQRDNGIEHLNQSMGLTECSLDYGVWRKHLERSSKDGPSGSAITNSVRVCKVTADDEAAENDTSQDFLLNYTFDLSLDNHMLGRA